MDHHIDMILCGKGSDIQSDFYEPIQIPYETHQAKVGIKNFATFNNIPNVVEGVINAG